MADPTPTVESPSKPIFRFRRTRIALSVVFGVLTVALCVLWMRSYRQSERLVWSYAPKHYAMLESVEGHLFLHIRFTGPDSTVPTNPRAFSFRSRRPTNEDLAASTNPLMHAGFGAWYSADFKYLAVPYWFAIASLGTISAVALPSTSYRFCLRTMLLSITLVAVALGLIVWLTN